MIKMVYMPMLKYAQMVFKFLVIDIHSVLAMHPAQLGNCFWEEWSSKTGNLQQENCSFVSSTGKWNTTAVNYTVPDEFRV